MIFDRRQPPASVAGEGSEDAFGGTGTRGNAFEL